MDGESQEYYEHEEDFGESEQSSDSSEEIEPFDSVRLFDFEVYDVDRVHFGGNRFDLPNGLLGFHSKVREFWTLPICVESEECNMAMAEREVTERWQ